MNVESFIKLVHPLLKEYNFKRVGTTWRRSQEESIAVFNIQKSQWGGGDYYINIGTYFHALGSDPSPTENKCHVQKRLEIKEPSKVVKTALEWFQERAKLQNAALLAESDSKKGLVFKELRNLANT